MKEKELLNQMQQLIENYTTINKIKTTIPFTQIILKWIEHKKNVLEDNTIDNYKITINKHLLPYFKNMKINTITEFDIQNYIKQKSLEGLSNNTINHHLTYINSILDWSFKNNLISHKFTNKIDRLPKQKYQAHFLSVENSIEFCNIFKGDIIELCVLLAIFLGLRRSEVLGLKWSCIDWNNKTIIINSTLVTTSKGSIIKNTTKSKSSNRILYIPDIIYNKLKEKYTVFLYNKNKYKNIYNMNYLEFIFTHKNGNIILPDYLSRRFKKIQIVNNITPIRFHDLRHSCAVILNELGYSLADISKWLGHSSISITSDIYVHLSDKRKRYIPESLNKFYA